MGTTLNTLNYMIAGYAVFAAVLTVYLISLLLRWRNLRRDLATLEEMEKK